MSEDKLHILNDVDMLIEVKVGGIKLTTEELISIEVGDEIITDRAGHEPFEVYIGNHHFAYGDLVIVNDCYALKITRIIAPPQVQNAG